jgi:hypothetical protein
MQGFMQVFMGHGVVVAGRPLKLARGGRLGMLQDAGNGRQRVIGRVDF